MRNGEYLVKNYSLVIINCVDNVHFCVTALRKYKAKLSFLPVTEYTPKSSNNNTTKALHIPTGARRASLNGTDDHDKQTRSKRNFMHSKSVPSQLFHDRSDGESSGQDENEAKLTDINEPFATGDFNTLDNETSTDEDVRTGDPSEKGDTNANTKNEVLNGARKSIRSAEDLFRLSTNGKGVSSSLLPQITEPVPPEWVTIEEEFVTVCATYQTHLGSDLIMAPDARFNDGIIHLCFIKAGIQKSELINLMTLLEKGTHIDHPSPNLEFIKCLAFRLEPESSEGIIMVDGEKVDTAPIQGQILPGLASIMAIQ